MGLLDVFNKKEEDKMDALVREIKNNYSNGEPYDKLISYIVHDKKANNNFVEMVKVNKIGTFEIENVEIEKIKEML